MGLWQTANGSVFLFGATMKLHEAPVTGQEEHSSNFSQTGGNS